jgi:hypothetical protein
LRKYSGNRSPEKSYYAAINFIKIFLSLSLDKTKKKSILKTALGYE